MNTRIAIGTVCISLGFLVAGCDRTADQNASTDTRSPTTTTTTNTTTDPNNTSRNLGTDSRAPARSNPTDTSGNNADNTSRNRDDLNNNTKTPESQSNSSEHIKITADIRRAIMDDDTMSVNAQNCKIITDKNGVVTLRGPVASQAEKDAIQAKAEIVVGAGRVVNELEVKTSN